MSVRICARKAVGKGPHWHVTRPLGRRASHLRQNRPRSIMSIMTFSKTLEKFNRVISGWFQWIAVFGIVVMMGLTCVDVIGAKVFRTPVFGAIDSMMLAQLVAVSFAAAMTLIVGKHIHVDFFWLVLPKRLQVIVDCIIYFLAFSLFVLIVWRLLAFAFYLQTGDEQSVTARIPLCPFVYAAAVGCFPVCLVYLQRLIQSIHKMVKNEP